jgi:hypothetical protein
MFDLNEAIARIDKLVIDCGHKGWDGSDAEPVSMQTATLAKQLLMVIGPQFAAPGNDGAICFEWKVSGGENYAEVQFIPDA